MTTLTKIRIRNFKKFNEIEVELGDPVVFIGPNNSGKTTALQALSLWNTGLQKWNEKRKNQTNPESRPGVPINRKELFAIPSPTAKLLWQDLQVRAAKDEGGTKNIRIEIVVSGTTEGKEWECGLEFDYANEESIYVRPLRISNDNSPDRMVIPDEVEDVEVEFLPPLSGLTTNEDKLTEGSINSRIGEGRTAEVLRNLCLKVYEEDEKQWERIVDNIHSFFGVKLNPPNFIKSTGQIEMSYLENRTEFDLTSAGRGLQQTLLVLTFMISNPNTAILIDEPDAHLEILRQQEIYRLLSNFSIKHNSQILAASHSEVILNEAAQKDVVVAFVGKPHRIDDQGSQVLKALKEIGYEDYYKAEQTGWVLYLEGATDFEILQQFASKLDYTEASKILERPFVKYKGNQYSEVQYHFFGLQEAYPKLKGIAIFDNDPDQEIPEDFGGRGLKKAVWSKREIENYLCYKETLLNFASSEAPGPLFGEKYKEEMRNSINEIKAALKTLEQPSPWSDELKVSTEFLTKLFKNFYARIERYNPMNKKDFHSLVRYTPQEKIDKEITQKLDIICEVANLAKTEEKE